MTNGPEPAPQTDSNALWGAVTELHSSIARIEGAVGRLEGAVNALIEGQRQLIEGQREINQRIDRVIFVGVTVGATLTAAMIGGLVAVAILG